jgi:PAB1-binding protein PBP1
MNFAPSEATCSLVAGRTSVAETMAPRRRAVAMACRPATPTPMMKALPAGTVPAAVIIIGMACSNIAAAFTTAL